MVKRNAYLTMLAAGWLVLGWHGNALAQTVTVNVSASEINLNTGLTVEFVLSDSPPDAAQPDWSVLEKDFQVLSRNQARSMRILNGKQTRSVTWRLELMPKRAGQLVIPPLKFGSSISQKKVIKVKKPPSAPSAKKPDIYLEATIEPKQIYVQQQAKLVIKVFMGKNLQGNITQPQANLQTIVEGFGAEKKYRTTLQGRMYQVYEKHYVLFPQASGALEVQPGHLTGHYVENRRRFSVNQKAPTVKAKVLPVPAQFSGGAWLPAKSVTLRQKWSGDIRQWEQGRPLTRTVHLSAMGLLPSQLSAVRPSEVPDFNVYSEPKPKFDKHISGKHVAGTREQQFVFIPRREGKHQLPEVRIPWWNTVSNKMEYAVLPPVPVQVVANKSGLLSDDEEMMQGGAVITEVSPTESDGVLAGTDRQYSSVWFWTSVVLGFGWFLTLLLMLHRGGILGAWRGLMSRHFNLHKATKQLKTACIAGEPGLVRDRLLQWSQLVWTESPPQTLGQLAAVCGKDLAEQIKRLNGALYGNGEWRRADLLWQAVNKESAMGIGKQDSDKKAGGDSLEPLHRLN